MFVQREQTGLCLLRASVCIWCMLTLFLWAEFAILCKLKHSLHCTPSSRAVTASAAAANDLK